MSIKTKVSDLIHAMKYRHKGETFLEQTARNAYAMADGEKHAMQIKEITRDLRFLFAGRVQSSMGSPRNVTAFNCFVSGEIKDNMNSIMSKASEAAETMRRGGGIGYDFSNIRPYHDRIVSLDSLASGPVSFMAIYEAVCQTIASAGHRRGAQMGVLRVDHPDIEYFIRCKQNNDKLNGFNISVGITDEFMHCLKNDKPFPLKFEGKVYKYLNAKNFWDDLMRITWDWAEPGVLFIDRINEYNNLNYCEKISATNPCGEQPLPPYGACLLGSFNLVKYIDFEKRIFMHEKFINDIEPIVRALDNVIDRTTYPLPEQEKEAKDKRRMGIGVTGVANAGAMLGLEYGSEVFLMWMEKVLETLTEEAYLVSTKLSEEKEPFPLYDSEKYLQSKFIMGRSDLVRSNIKKYGIRNSHLTSIAPTGTISFTADNVSSGIEPPYQLEGERLVQTFDGPITMKVVDYAYKFHNIKTLTADQVDAFTHVNVMNVAQRYVDSSISKTCNVGDDVNFNEFKEIYINAYEGGAKGCTTFRKAGKRFSIFTATDDVQDDEKTTEACYISPETGVKTCDE